jgi:DNA mismatch repair ATPase MutS
MLKGKHPDALLLFRNGDNYESYAEDADKVSKLLKFDKTIGMESGSKNQVDIVSFSSYNLDTFLPELIRAGNRVAICDKVEHKETIDNEQQEEVRTGRHL